jgi:hypothetical protein
MVSNPRFAALLEFGGDAIGCGSVAATSAADRCSCTDLLPAAPIDHEIVGIVLPDKKP